MSSVWNCPKRLILSEVSEFWLSLIVSYTALKIGFRLWLSVQIITRDGQDQVGKLYFYVLWLLWLSCAGRQKRNVDSSSHEFCCMSFGSLERFWSSRFSDVSFWLNCSNRVWFFNLPSTVYYPRHTHEDFNLEVIRKATSILKGIIVSFDVICST